jgi:hypothetical protein
MDQFMGIVMFVITGIWVARFRPRFRRGQALCVLCGVMGLVSLLSAGGSWYYELIQTFLQVVTALCCFAELKKERIFLLRRRSQTKNCRVHRIQAKQRDPRGQMPHKAAC